MPPCTSHRPELPRTPPSQNLPVGRPPRPPCCCFPIRMLTAIPTEWLPFDIVRTTPVTTSLHWPLPLTHNGYNTHSLHHPSTHRMPTHTCTYSRASPIFIFTHSVFPGRLATASLASAAESVRSTSCPQAHSMAHTHSMAHLPPPISKSLL